jgi:L-iditol 2-dehydrogenase
MLMRNPIENVSFRMRGGYSQYMKIPESMIRAGEVIPVSDSIDKEEGALIEPAACALESIFATPHAYGVDGEGRHIIKGGIKKGGRVCIIGSGTLAMIYGTLCGLEGAAEIWYIVRSEEKKEMARRIVGNHVKALVLADYSSLEIGEKLRYESTIEAELTELTGGYLFDDIVLAAASVDGQRLMMRLLNPDGYGVAAQFAGLHELSTGVNVDAVHYRIGKIIGTSGCGTAAMETIARWLVEGKLSLKGYVGGKHFTLDDDPAEFLSARGDGLKPMLYPWERRCA